MAHESSGFQVNASKRMTSQAVLCQEALSGDGAHMNGRAHDVVETHGRFRCVTCLATASKRSMLPVRCDSSLRGHRLWSLDDGRMLFCSSCGGYSSLQRRSLGVGCHGHAPRGSSAAWRLERLWSGLHPASGQRLSTSRPLPYGDFVWDAKFGGLHIVSHRNAADGESATAGEDN